MGRGVCVGMGRGVGIGIGRGICGRCGTGEPDAVPPIVKPNPENIITARPKIFKVWFFIVFSIQSFEFLPSLTSAMFPGIGGHLGQLNSF
jgi:hypothetical protein